MGSCAFLVERGRAASSDEALGSGSGKETITALAPIDGVIVASGGQRLEVSVQVLPVD